MEQKKVLFVDDDPNILNSFKRQLRKDFNLDIAIGAQAGLRALRMKGPYAVVVSDMQMPGMDGIELLTQAQELSPDTVRIMLTGNADQGTAVRALNEGDVFRFINKPAEPADVAKILKLAIRQHELLTAEKDLLQNTLNGSIKVLTDILGMVDPVSFGKAEKLRARVRNAAKELGFENLWECELAAMLSNIGSVALPASVAEKVRNDEALSSEEEILVTKIPHTGKQLLENIPRMQNIAQIVAYQAKRFDGDGLPKDDVRGEDIPNGARLLRILIDLEKHERSTKKSTTDCLERMAKTNGVYDTTMLQGIIDMLKNDEGVEEIADVPKEEISVSGLRIGQELLADVKTNEGMLLITAGNKLTRASVERIANYHQLSGVAEPIIIKAVEDKPVETVL